MPKDFKKNYKMPKYNKKQKDQIAEKLAASCICTYSKSAPMILRLAARKAKEILEKAKQTGLSAK